MEEENLVPNTGNYFNGTEPTKQKVARTKEKANTLQALPVLKDLLKRLDERIQFYGSIEAMPDEVKTSPTKFMNWHNANELTRANLIAEKEYIESLLETHAKGL